jgi:predicted ArsR family transcriptional regulator
MRTKAKDHGEQYKKVVALLKKRGPKTKLQIQESLGISETSARRCLNIAQQERAVYVSDWHRPEMGRAAKVYKFGTGITPPRPRVTPPRSASSKVVAETLRKVRSMAAQYPSNPFASLMVQVA